MRWDSGSIDWSTSCQEVPRESGQVELNMHKVVESPPESFYVMQEASLATLGK